MRAGFHFFRDSAFKQQLNIAVTTGVLFFAIVSSLLTSWQGSHQIRRTLLEQGERIAENLASQSTLALLYSSAENANQAVKTTLSFPDVTRVEIRHANGQALLVSGGSTAPTSDAPLADKGVRQAYLEAESDDAWRFVAPVLSRGDDSPFDMVERQEVLLGFVRIVQSKATMSRMLAQIFLANLVISLLFAAAFLFVLRKLADRLTRPITELSDAMARAERGASNVRANLSGPQDIRDMAKAFNSMIAALQEREQALRESQASYREVVESVKEVIFQTDAAGLWVLLNPAWEEITGIDVQRVLGRPMSELVHADDREQAESWQARLEAGDVQNCRFEVRIARSDGDIRWLEVSQRARWNANGSFAGTSGTLSDITERWLAAERLENLNAELEHRVRVRTAQLEASNHELEAFSYSVSHDLRSPLRAIDGFAAILEEEAADKLDAGARQHLARVRAGAQRMSQLIDDLLQLARISRASLDCRMIDLGILAGEIVRELSEVEPQRQVEFSVGENLVAFADPVLVRVALDNLLRNAWKFTGKCEQARISFGAKAVESAGGTETAFFVSDNGAGFDMSYANQLFRPFSRLHSESEYAGTGVGLANVQRVIQRHGGRIWAQAEVAHGATFYFTLPDSEAEDKALPNP
jgi:PAS domain S-box-containing protein